MMLHVEFDQFAQTVERLLQTKEAYCKAKGGAVVVTASHPDRSVVVASVPRLTVTEIRLRLQQDGFEVRDGEWTDAGESAAGSMGGQPPYIAAVAYSSREKMPGLWLDAYAAQPVTGAVLRAFYDEFASNGEIPEVSFEEFVRLANPNVVILTPEEIQGFIVAKENC